MISEKAYPAALRRVQSDWPDHPLLKILSTGPTLLNRARIEQILVQISERLTEEANTPQALVDIEYNDLNTEDSILRGLYIEKSNLFVERARYSNRLHDCASDSERAKVVSDILITQRRIEDIFHRIKEYIKTGQLPEMDAHIPNDPVGLVLKMNSLRASVSYFKRKAQELYHTVPRTEEVEAKMVEVDNKIKELEIVKKHVQKRIDSLRGSGLQS
jgi:hypothetical protein